MKTFLVEKEGEKQKLHNLLLVEPKHLAIFSNMLAVKIINELSKQPMCAMDIAKNLKQHEQKIYYHMRKMKGAGIIRSTGTESRYGMTAKMFELTSPVVATKLYENANTVDNAPKISNPDAEKLFNPFVKDGKLNATIIFGDGRPHGKYEGSARDGAFTTDFSIFMGSMINEMNVPCYKIDTIVKEDDLKNNIIIIGGPRINTVAEKINEFLPIKFDTKTWRIISTLSNKIYDDDFIGVVVKCDNPFNRKKKMLFIGGKKSRGTIAAVIALTRHTKDVLEGNMNNKDVIAKVVKGTDKDADGFIDSIHFLE
ncbi:ArsR family transcriptional regulator [archaeon]|nr:ArsR family transcriptional regulator [archaeon]